MIKNKLKKGLFSKKVRKIVSLIPRGKTLTYKKVATLAGSPRAARAVARIMATNYDTNIPCHRVIRSDGTLGGYNRGGIEVKRALLKAELQTNH